MPRKTHPAPAHKLRLVTLLAVGQVAPSRFGFDDATPRTMWVGLWRQRRRTGPPRRRQSLERRAARAARIEARLRMNKWGWLA